MKKRIIQLAIIGLFLLMLPLMAGADIVDSGECGNGLLEDSRVDLPGHLLSPRDT